MSIIRPELAAFGLGGGELMIVLIIILVLFGGAKLPSLARGLGQSIKEFKKASREGEEEHDDKPAAKPEEKKSEPANTHGAN